MNVVNLAFGTSLGCSGGFQMYCLLWRLEIRSDI